MTSIKKVAVAGGTGNLGPSILSALIAANFTVTVLTRDKSKHTFPSSASVIEVDFNSPDSLVSALTGQDAVVVTIGTEHLSVEPAIISAAAKAGVKRFIPSEFGNDTTNPKNRAIPYFKDKLAAQDALKAEAEKGQMSYTLLMTGPFFDWGLKVGFILDLNGKSATIVDGGERPASLTTLETIGKAVAGVLRHPEETKNRAVRVHSVAITMNKLLALSKEVKGKDGWEEKHDSSDEMVQRAWAELKKEEPNHMVGFSNFILAALWGEGYGSKYEKTDNELLGIKEMSDDEVLEMLKGLVQ